MRMASVFMVILMLAASSIALAGNNPQVTFPLHAKASSFEACTGLAPVDCTGEIGSATRPTVNVSPGAVAVFMTVMNYTGLLGVQTAFENGGNWVFAFGLWDCQVGQLNAVTPAPPFGPTAGSITTAFNCVTSGVLVPIGRLHFASATSGCLSQVQSTYPFGIHASDCALGVDQITDSEQARLGKICVGSGGVDACDPVSAVDEATWGRIKASF
jgi:hypothetical protein